jgi:hypothetical protein
MKLTLDPSIDLSPAPRVHVGLRIAAFLTSLVLAFAGVLHGAMAIVAYISGDLVGAVGQGAEKVSADAAAEHPDPDSLAAAAAPRLDDVAKSAKSFALRAKLIAIAVGLLAAALLLGGELVRRREPSVAVAITLGVAIAGEVAMAIFLSPSVLLAIGGVGALAGLAVWWKVPRERAVLATT